MELELHETETAGSMILTDRLCPSLMCIQEPSLVADRITSSHRRPCVFRLDQFGFTGDPRQNDNQSENLLKAQMSLKALNE